jgi:hypothetical protein
MQHKETVMANQATPNEVRIWYELHGRPASVIIASNAVVDDLRRVIKAEWGDRLQCAAAELDIFQPGTTSFESRNNILDPGDIVPNDTSSNAENGKGPLIVVPPSSPLLPPTLQRHQQDGK